MVARFSLIGRIKEINPPRVTTAGNSVAMLVTEIDNSDFPVIIQGKLLQLIENDKLKVNDIALLEGRMAKDSTFNTTSAKVACILYCAYINVISI